MQYLQKSRVFLWLLPDMGFGLLTGLSMWRHLSLQASSLGHSVDGKTTSIDKWCPIPCDSQ